jgi:hypothetical protein
MEPFIPDLRSALSKENSNHRVYQMKSRDGYPFMDSSDRRK